MMKKAFSQKAQVYGLSSFIYALAIALVLLVGLIGMSKEFEVKSQSSKYEGSAIVLERTAETVKKILEQERRYALEKSLFMTGALGGNGIYAKSNCGDRTNTLIPYLADKVIRNWQNKNSICIPSDADVINTVTNFTTSYFAKPDSSVTSILYSLTGDTYNYRYVPKIVNYGSTFTVSWFPQGTVTNSKGISSALSEITLKYPVSSPLVEYSFQPFVQTESREPFFAMKQEAEKFVRNYAMRSLLNDSNSDNKPIPFFADEEFIIAKRTSSMGSERNCNTDSNRPNEYCTEPANPRPFRALVAYVFGNYPKDSADWTKYSCNSLNPDLVSDSTNLQCTIFTKYNPDTRMLEVDSKQGIGGFSSSCGWTGSLNLGSQSAYDAAALRCVLIASVIQASKDIASYSSGTNFDWKLVFDTYNLTYGKNSNFMQFKYNTTV